MSKTAQQSSLRGTVAKTTAAVRPRGNRRKKGFCYEA